MIRALALLAALAASPAAAAELFFCWVGNAGYTMTGRIGFPDALLTAPRVTEADLTRFEISGYRDGGYLGSWDMRDRRPETSWLLSFDPATMRFPMSGIGVFQAWNANGAVTDCGSPGFGFNAGSAGQDICVDGRFIRASTIPWHTPLTAVPDPVSPDCGGPAQLSGRIARHSAPGRFVLD